MDDACERIKLREVDKHGRTTEICAPDINKKIFDEVSPSVVKVDIAVGWESGANGSGFFVNPRQIITNSHVVMAGDNLTIKDKFNNAFQGKIIKVDEVRDLALVELVDYQGQASQGRPLKLRNDAIKNGEAAWALGHPADSSSLALSPGTIIDQAKRFSDDTLRAKVIAKIEGKAAQTSALRYLDEPSVFSTVNIEPGSSGGPATNEAGELTFVTSLASAVDAKNNKRISSGVSAAQVKDFLTNNHSDFKSEYQWETNLQHRPVKTTRDDLAIAATSAALPQLFVPLTAAYHAYKLIEQPNNTRKIVDPTIISGAALFAISKPTRTAGAVIYGAGLALDACYDAFAKDHLILKNLTRTDGSDHQPAGNLVLEIANEPASAVPVK